MNKSYTETYRPPKRGQYIFDQIPLDDPRVFGMISQGRTKGIFQLETQLGRDWAKRLRPVNIDELSALIALLRPGALESNMSDHYCDRKNGLKPVEYFHPALEPILKDTYACLIYQESVLKICSDIAGMDLVQSDLCRRAMGKKKPEEMAKVKKVFLECIKQAKIVTEEEGAEIFSWIQKSVRYLFNASHSYSYAIISYLTAYQKYHFPTEFYCSWLTYSDWKPAPREEIYELVQDMRLGRVQIKPPDIRKKNVDFEIIQENELIFGLSHIKNVGASTIDKIQNPKYTFDTFIDLLKTSKKLRRNVVESLIKAGACDCYGLSRTYMLRCLYTIFGYHHRDSEDHPIQNRSLSTVEYKYFMSAVDEFGIEGTLETIISEEICVKRRIPIIEAKIAKIRDNTIQDTNRRKSIWERLYLGLNLTCSATDDIQESEKNSITCKQIYYLKPKETFITHVVIDDIRKRKTSFKAKHPGEEYCYLSVSDNSLALPNLICWPNVYKNVKDLLKKDLVITVYGRKNLWNNREQLIINQIKVIG